MKRGSSCLQAAGQAAAAEDHDDDDLHVPTDAEATIMLLRQKLYPDPAQAAAAASAAKQARHAKHSKGAAGPSKATAAAIAAAAAAAAAAKQLPPIVLKSQLYTVLTDKTAADRDLENLRQKGRVRVFKLAIGADEYVLLLADDYMAIINRLIQQHQHLAAQHTPQPTGAPSAAADLPTDSSSSSEDASISATLQLFRDRVVPAWRDASIPATTLLQLLRTAPSRDLAPAAATATPAGNSRPAAAAAAAAAAAGSAGGRPAHERHLLALDLVTRDIRSPDSYVLTVPGAAAFVRSVTAGRQELLQLLARKKYNELLEKELVCVKLRNSCLTPSYIARDLQGKGLITVIDTTAGPLVRLAQRK